MMNSHSRSVGQLLLAIFVVALSFDAALGQYRDEPPRSAEESQQRFRRTEFFLAELDANRNGVLEADECTGRRQFFVERMLQRAGLPVQYPVAMDRVREGLQRSYTNAAQAGAQGGAPPGSPFPGGGPPGGPWGGGPPGGPWGGGPPGAPPATPGSGGPPASAAPLLPGFGVPSAAPAVPGFGPVTAPTTGAVGAPEPVGGGSSSGHSDDQRYRDYAKQLFGQYDKNRNGVLERDEYHEMSNNPKAADKNGDGVISFDELFGWLVEMSKSGSHSGSSGGDNRGRERERERDRSKKEEPKQPVYRVPVPSPVDRLPSGLPEWFLKKDVDRDGQVSMAEFSQDWSESKLTEYFKYDVNGDGFILPAEVLRVEKGTSQSTSRPPTSPSGGSSGSSSGSGSGGSSDRRWDPRAGRSEQRGGEPDRGAERGGSNDRERGR